MGITFRCDWQPLEAKFVAALEGLQQNLLPVYGYDRPVLREGAEYQGIWLECGPHEGLVYGMVDPQIALHNHRIFFQLQQPNGYIPCWVWQDSAGTGQIQMVVPLAATAYEVYELYGDETFLEMAYTACAKWDRWLRTYRDTRGTGLCEAFCEFDTGHDNSPRWTGLPKECPERDARNCPAVGALPYLAPDLSATVYGGRLALARMARRLGRTTEAQQWEDLAQQMKEALLAYCFDAEDLCFYDLDRARHFVRLRGDALTRVLGEHVVDQALFDAIYTTHIKDPAAFWTPYPLPSIAANDLAFVHALPANSWGGASQALTALRAPRWFGHYGKHVDLVTMMTCWMRALVRADGFRQQMNPWTGDFTPSSNGYSPAMLVLIDYVTRLYGVRRMGTTLEWNCSALPGEASTSSYALDTPYGEARLERTHDQAWLTIAGMLVASIQGECRIVTDAAGNIQKMVGTGADPVDVTVTFPLGQERRVHVDPDVTLAPI